MLELERTKLHFVLVRVLEDVLELALTIHELVRLDVEDGPLVDTDEVVLGAEVITEELEITELVGVTYTLVEEAVELEKTELDTIELEGVT